MTDCPECHRRVGRVSSVRTHATTVARCANRGGPLCKVAAHAYRLGRAAGMDEAVEVAKAHALAFCTDCRWKSGEEIEWDAVDAEIARRKESA